MAALMLVAKLSSPSGLWPSIINGINNGLLNFGWTIVLFTLIVKVAMSPFDFLMRWSSKKTTLVQKKLQPQVAKINKKYANDRQKANIQTQALYKREGLNIYGSCLISIVYLVLTMVVFFTLFADLRKFAAYEVVSQYEQMEQKYDEVMAETADTEAAEIAYNLEFADSGDKDKAQQKYDEIIAETGNSKKASDEAAKIWNKNKDSWLWIDNIWRADTQANPMPDYNALKKVVSSGKYKSVSEKLKTIDEAKYKLVTASAANSENRGWNGYYILAILAVGLTFLSQFVSELGNKVERKKKKERVNKFYKPLEDKDKKTEVSSAGTLKLMKYILPVIMVIFVITSSAAFGIYIVVSSAVSILINLLINYLVKIATKKQEAEVMAALEKQEKKNEK